MVKLSTKYALWPASMPNCIFLPVLHVHHTFTMHSLHAKHVHHALRVAVHAAASLASYMPKVMHLVRVVCTTHDGCAWRDG